MKTYIKIILVTFSLFGWTGCAINNYRTNKDGTTSLHQYVFLQKAAFDGLKVSPKTGLSIKAAGTETQQEVVAAMTEAAVQGAIKGAGTLVKP